MSSENQPLDLAQRIVEALSRTGEAPALSQDDEDTSRATKIGEVPLHLRHLACLGECLYTEMEAAQKKFADAQIRLEQVKFETAESERRAATDGYFEAEIVLLKAEENYETVYNLLFTSLEEHTPTKGIYEEVFFNNDWSVHGQNNARTAIVVTL